MNKIEIKPGRIESIQATIDQETLQNFNIIESIQMVDDSSTAVMNALRNEIRDSTNGLGEAVENFNNYLNQIAQHFRKKDGALAGEIEAVTFKSIPTAKQQAAQKKQKAKTSTTYKILP